MSTFWGIAAMTAFCLLWALLVTGLLLLPAAAYSLGRVAAKTLGLGNASAEQFTVERKRLRWFGLLYAAILIMTLLMDLVIKCAGIFDGPG
jgi:hypothetical protein